MNVSYRKNTSDLLEEVLDEVVIDYSLDELTKLTLEAQQREQYKRQVADDAFKEVLRLQALLSQAQSLGVKKKR